MQCGIPGHDAYIMKGVGCAMCYDSHLNLIPQFMKGLYIELVNSSTLLVFAGQPFVIITSGI